MNGVKTSIANAEDSTVVIQRGVQRIPQRGKNRNIAVKFVAHNAPKKWSCCCWLELTPRAFRNPCEEWESGRAGSKNGVYKNGIAGYD